MKGVDTKHLSTPYFYAKSVKNQVSTLKSGIVHTLFYTTVDIFFRSKSTSYLMSTLSTPIFSKRRLYAKIGGLWDLVWSGVDSRRQGATS